MKEFKKLTRGKSMRLPLQKIDKRTNEIISLFRDFLFSVGVRTSHERAWVILQKAHRLPFEYLIELNKEGIKYQGSGQHISAKHGNQLMVIKELGRFELKAVSARKDQEKQSTIRYTIPRDLLREVREKVKVLDDE